MEDDVAEFESGFSGEAATKLQTPEAGTTETVEQAEPGETKVETAAEQVAEPAKEDPLKEIRDLLEKQNARIRNTEGHIGGLNHHLKQMQETFAASQAASKQVTDAPTKSQVKDAMESPKEWSDLKDEYPEWATAVEKLMDSRLPKAPGDDVLKGIDERIKTQTESVRKEIIESSLDAVFPGWADEVKMPEFAAWVGSQSHEVQSLAASEKVADAARMLRLYEKHRDRAPEPTPDTRAATRLKRIEAAVTPKGTSGFTPTPTELDEFEAGFAGR